MSLVYFGHFHLFFTVHILSKSRHLPIFKSHPFGSTISSFKWKLLPRMWQAVADGGRFLVFWDRSVTS